MILNKKMKDSFNKCKQIRRKLQICSHLLKKILTESLIFYASNFLINKSLLETNSFQRCPSTPPRDVIRTL